LEALHNSFKAAKLVVLDVLLWLVVEPTHLKNIISPGKGDDKKIVETTT